MKKMIAITLALFMILGVSCSDDISEEITKLNDKITSLESELEESKAQLALHKLEILKQEQAVRMYEESTIPNLKTLVEKAVTEKFTMEDKYTQRIQGYESNILAFKNDLKDIFLFLDEEGMAPVYEGAGTEYTDIHLQAIYDYFSQYSQDYEKGKSLGSIYDPIIYPIKITPTQVGYTSQYDESYFYNVATYHTMGMESDDPDDCWLRCHAAVHDGLWETYIFEIAKANGVWKIVYVGFGG